MLMFCDSNANTDYEMLLTCTNCLAAVEVEKDRAWKKNNKIA